MIGTFDLNFEKILIKELAEEIYESITSMADITVLVIKSSPKKRENYGKPIPR